MYRRPWTRVGRVAAPLLTALTLSAALTGCALPLGIVGGTPGAPARDAAGLPTGPVSYAEVNSHAEAHLAYPGSRPVGRFGAGEYHHPFSGHDDAAFAGGILATAAMPAQVYRWYERWALAHGWRPHDFPLLATERSLKGFERGRREIYIVAIDNPHLLSETTGRAIPRARTIYEISYSILPESRSTSHQEGQ